MDEVDRGRSITRGLYLEFGTEKLYLEFVESGRDREKDSNTNTRRYIIKEATRTQHRDDASKPLN